MAKKYFTYILTHEGNHIFYVGVTNNIKRRMSEHKTATFGTHVGHYNIKKLVYFENIQTLELPLDEKRP